MIGKSKSLLAARGEVFVLAGVRGCKGKRDRGFLGEGLQGDFEENL